MIKKAIKYIFSDTMKKKIMVSAPICFAITFSIIIFGPFDLFLHNKAEFPFCLGEVISSFLIAAFVVFIIGLFIVLVIPKAVSEIVICILSGLLLSSYIQILFLNKGNIVITKGKETFNLYIYIAIFVVPLTMYIISKIWKNDFWRKATIFFPSLIFIMQFSGLISAAITNESGYSQTKELYYFSYEEQFKMSSEENIIVFILDRLDTMFLEEALEKYPDISDALVGFTFYTNNVSTGLYTYPSIVNMITGEPYTNEITREEYLTSAWNNAQLFDILHEYDYSVNMLMDGVSMYYSPKDVLNKVDNIKTTDISNRAVNHGTVVKYMVSFSIARHAPLIMNASLDSYTPFAIEKFVTITGVPDYFPPYITAKSDLLYYDKLKETKLSLDSSKSTFSFMHLNSAHAPYGYDENLNPVLAKDARMYPQIRGSFKILEEYFAQLKELGIYDSSTIIIIADHGEIPSWSMNGNKLASGLNNRPLTSLLIKPKNSDDTPLGINTTAELSSANFIATILDIIGADTEEFGPSWFAIAKDNLPQTRILELYLFQGLFVANYGGKYEITGNAHNPDNWRFSR